MKPNGQGPAVTCSKPANPLLIVETQLAVPRLPCVTDNISIEAQVSGEEMRRSEVLNIHGVFSQRGGSERGRSVVQDGAAFAHPRRRCHLICIQHESAHLSYRSSSRIERLPHLKLGLSPAFAAGESSVRLTGRPWAIGSARDETRTKHGPQSQAARFLAAPSFPRRRATLASSHNRLGSGPHQDQLVGLFGDCSKTPYHTSNRSHTGTSTSIAC